MAITLALSLPLLRLPERPSDRIRHRIIFPGWLPRVLIRFPFFPHLRILPGRYLNRPAQAHHFHSLEFGGYKLLPWNLNWSARTGEEASLMRFVKQNDIAIDQVDARRHMAWPRF